jgi:ketosteroid isomerase-like protein
MSRQNVEMVENAISAANTGDWDAFFGAMGPGFEFDMSRADGPGRGIYGPDQARRQLEDFAGYWESVRIEPDEFIEAGELVVVPMSVHVRGRDGIDVVSRPTFVWAIRDGAVSRVSMYQERREALEALALSEDQ